MAFFDLLKKPLLKIEVGGKILTPLSTRIIKTMDVTGPGMLDSWACTVAWTPGKDPGFDALVLPLKYPKSKIYIDGKLQISGLTYKVETSFDSGGQTVTLTGFPFIADLLDSNIKPPYTKKDSTLEDRANELVAPTGIRAIFEESSGGIFKDITSESGEKIFDHLLKYASQRGLIMASNAEGELLFWKAKTSGQPIANIQEGEDFKFPPTVPNSAMSYAASFDGRKVFNSYRVIRDTPDKSDVLQFIFGSKPKVPNAVSIDDNIPRSRFATIQASETTSGGIQKTADFVRSTAYAEMMTNVLTMPGWKTQKGTVWEVNTLISVKSPTLMIPDGYTFLIKQIEFTEDSGGQNTSLSLVPPQVYSGEPIPYIWAAKSPGIPTGVAL